ncbi:MAG TPA: nitroreductase family deazaflavin-dependent oxidoreductase [Anaerolineae bacterium]|nr:nitroreductase family deazaflavin-dependent oxidoreductase [Anaerolineae bacterium]
MAKQYQVNAMVRFVNRVMMHLNQWGIAAPNSYVLTVRGRKTGKTYAVPVLLVENGHQRWLVSPYGEVSWVRNARAAGEVTLSRKGRSETLKIRAATPQESAPILKLYMTREKIVRPYFDVTPDAPLEAFAAEAPRHPVFQLLSQKA